MTICSVITIYRYDYHCTQKPYLTLPYVSHSVSTLPYYVSAPVSSSKLKGRGQEQCPALSNRILTDILGPRLTFVVKESHAFLFESDVSPKVEVEVELEVEVEVEVTVGVPSTFLPSTPRVSSSCLK